MLVRKALIIFSLLLCLSSVRGQTSSEQLDIIVQNFVQDLRIKGIDTFCVYKDYCVGCVYTWNNREDRCDSVRMYVSTYIIWLDNASTFMTRKDNCFDFPTIQFEGDSIWEFFFVNRYFIEKEEIKMPQFAIVNNGKTEIYASSTNHSWHQNIQFIFHKDTIISKDLDDYHFEKEIGSERRKNINYEYNAGSYLKRFQELISRTIKSATQMENFRKKEDRDASLSFYGRC